MSSATIDVVFLTLLENIKHKTFKYALHKGSLFESSLRKQIHIYSGFVKKKKKGWDTKNSLTFWSTLNTHAVYFHNN